MTSKLSAAETETETETDAALRKDVDRLSLEQALRDFEIANARAIELTQRLVDLSKEIERLRAQVVDSQEQAAAARAENEAIRASMSFRLVELSTKIRRRLGR